MFHRLKITANLFFITLFLYLTNTNVDTPITAWGIPNLQGVWTAATVTPLERPETLNDKLFLMEEEREEFFLSRSANPDPGTPGGYNRFSLDPGTVTLDDGRSSLIVEPADGRIPWHPEAKQWPVS
ncbi:MAG: hypothetical protein P8N40_01985 [Gammaproteobacteria bacterium]|nr:hypothetical protein [Gammaproteobacteria bacterium]